MSCPENTSAKIISLLSAFELEEAMERVSDVAMEACGGNGAAVLMWDGDMEAIADRMFFGEHQKEMRILADSLAEEYENYEFSPTGGDIQVEILDEVEDLELPSQAFKNLGQVYLITVATAGERRAILVVSGAETAVDAAAAELGPYPIGLVLSKGWEVKELQRENERLRSQYEEIEDKTSNMEEQTRKLIHDITARDSIRMKQLERERLVYWISNAVRSSVHIKEVLEMTVEKIGNTFGVSRCMLLRGNEQAASLDVFEFTRKGEASARELLYSAAGREFTRQALSKTRPEHIEDPAFSPSSPYDRQFLQGLNLRSGLTVPLLMRDCVLGVLFLQDTDATRDWSIDDISLIGSLADNLSVAIENAELHQERERQAVTDGLTGVYNRRAFTETLEKEFERAMRHEQTLSLIIIDLDYLKKINDNFGHMAGDEAIRSIGLVLRQSSRSIDFCARYGGEEFCLLLPNTEIEMAEQLAERLRRLINEVQIEGYGNISASLGVASFPLHCQSADELFHKADEALYKAKQGGRNCVQIAVPLAPPSEDNGTGRPSSSGSAAEVL